MMLRKFTIQEDCDHRSQLVELSQLVWPEGVRMKFYHFSIPIERWSLEETVCNDLAGKNLAENSTNSKKQLLNRLF